MVDRYIVNVIYPTLASIFAIFIRFLIGLKYKTAKLIGISGM